MTTITFASPRTHERTKASLEDRRLRRVQWVWALLFFNVLSFAVQPMAVPIPHKVGQVLTQGALVAALILALSVNPKVKIRPSVFLGLYSILAVTTMMTSIRLVGFGTAYRGLRLVIFVAVLWLLTPWWGRRDLLLLRAQVRFLVLILVSVVVGLVLSPHAAFPFNAGAHRLSGALWPMPATQLGHYMAELTGLTLLLWVCGLMKRRTALMIVIPSATALVLTHTRTALVAMLVGLLVAALSLFTSSRRVRKILGIGALVVAVGAIPLAPALSNWLVRGESAGQVANLSGRTEVWPAVLSEQRPELNMLLGSGMSNGAVDGAQNPAVDGRPIDDSWLETYQNQGLVGDILDAAIFLSILFIALLRPRGPARAMALFLLVYCFIASFTETGMGDASTYLLDMTVAASLLALPSGIGPVTWAAKKLRRDHVSAARTGNV
jgi:O-Antigen ligase